MKETIRRTLYGAAALLLVLAGVLTRVDDLPYGLALLASVLAIGLFLAGYVLGRKG